MELEGRRFYYKQLSYKYSIRNDFILCFLIFFDFLNIFSYLMITASKIIYGFDNFKKKDSYFYYISVYQHYKDYFPTNKLSYLLVILFLTTFIYVLFYIGLNLLKKEHLQTNNNLIKTLIKFYINLYELVIYRNFFIFAIDGDIGLLIYLINYSDKKSESFNFKILISEFFIIIIFFGFSVGALNHYYTFSVTANIKYFKDSFSDFPYDMNFSVAFDIITFFLKIFICLDKNIEMFYGIEAKKKLIVFGVFGIVVYFSYFTYLLIQLLKKESYILYFPLTIYVKFRIFLVSLAGFSTLYRFIIKEKRNTEFWFMFVLTCFSLMTFFIFNYDQIVKNRIVNTNNIITLLMYLLCNKTEEKNVITKWTSNHKINCVFNNSCLICDSINKKFDENEIEYSNFFNLLLKVKHLQKSSKKEKPRKIDEIYLDILDLFGMFYKKEHQKFNFYFNLYKRIIKYKKIQFSVFSDFLIMFYFNKMTNIDFYQIYESFKENEEIYNLILKFNKCFNEFICYHSKTPINFIKLSNELFNFSNHPNIIKIFKKNNNKNSYDIFLYRFIFENLTRSPIEKNEEFFDITLFQDYIENHYKFDNFIVIHYGIISQNFTIIKTTRKMKDFVGKNFEILFPKFLRKNAKKKLISSLNNNNFKDNNNIFEFAINSIYDSEIDESIDEEDDDEEYIELFQLKFQMFPSTNFSELLIMGNCKHRQQEIILFEVIKNGIISKEILISFSKGLKSFLVINPELINLLSILKKTFSFHQIFKKISASAISKNKSDEKEDSNDIYLQINYNVYLKLVKQYIEDNIDLEEKEKIIKKIKNNKSEILSLNYKLIKKNYVDENNKFILYFLEKIDKNQKEEENEQNFINKLNENSNFDDTMNKLLGTNESMSMISLSQKSDNLKVNFNLGKNKKKNLEELAINEKFIFINRIIIFCHIIISIFSLCLLLIQLSQDKTFINYYKFIENYNYFKRGINTEIVRMTSNFCFLMIDNSTEPQKNYSDCKFQTLSKAYLNIFNMTDENFLMSKIIYEEFLVAIDGIKNTYTKFKEKVYSLSQNKINELENTLISFYLMTDNNTFESNVELIYYKYNYFTLIDVYLNLLTQLINRNQLILNPIQFFTLNENFTISNTVFETLTEDKRLIYELIINYPFVQRALIETNQIILKWYNEHLDLMKKVVKYFFICMILFNCFVIVLQIIFIFIFREVLNKKYLKFIKKIHNQKFIEYFHNKFLILKDLLKLYEYEPFKKIHSLIENKKKYYKYKESKKKLKEEQQDSYEYSLLNKNNKKQDYKIYSSYLNPFFLAIYIIYFFDISIQLILYFIIIVKYNELDTLVKYDNYSADMDYYFMNNINSIQFLIITNSSQEFFAFLMTGERNKTNYVTDNLQQIIIIMKMVQSLENENAKIHKNIIDFQNTSCETLPNLNDENFNSIIKEGMEDSYKQYLTNLCKTFEIFDMSNQIIVFKGITYYEKLILDSVHNLSFYEKLNNIDIQNLYGVYTIILFLIDILRNYQNGTILPNLLKETLDSHKKTLIVCLIINFVFELLVTIVIFFTICKKLINVNTRIIHFLNFFK